MHDCQGPFEVVAVAPVTSVTAVTDVTDVARIIAAGGVLDNRIRLLDNFFSRYMYVDT
jgi:hypothetical protein